MRTVARMWGEHGLLEASMDAVEDLVSRPSSRAALDAVAGFLGALLRGHATREERLVFEPLERRAGANAVPLVYLRMVHDVIDQLLADIPVTADPEEASARLRDVLALVRRHFREEEEWAFPAACAVR